jgi:hypothetical protein
LFDRGGGVVEVMDIKPCPSCKEKAGVYPVDVFGIDDEPHGRQRVCCSNAMCLMQGPLGANAVDAVVRWNALPR